MLGVRLRSGKPIRFPRRASFVAAGGVVAVPERPVGSPLDAYRRGLGADSPQFWRGFPHRDPINRVVQAILDLRSRGVSPIKVLDLGFGSGAHWRGLELPADVDLTVVDLSEQWVSQVSFPAPSQVVVGRIPEVLAHLPDRSFHVVMAFDLIEHLAPSEGYLLSYAMQRLCGDCAILYTPNGFVPQPPSPDNPFNAHISGWRAADLRDMGWVSLRGESGPRWFVGSYGLPRFRVRTKTLRCALSLLSRLVLQVPSWSFAISAVYRPVPATGANAHLR